MGVSISALGAALAWAHITIATSPTEIQPHPQLSKTNCPPAKLTPTNPIPDLQLHLPETPEPIKNPFGLAPGVYVTKPFSCMVKVPGPQPDDSCILPATIPTNSIPNIKPQLQFTPLPPSGM